MNNLKDAIKNLKKPLSRNKKKKKINYDGFKNRDMTIIGKNTNFTITEAYKTLRTNIIFILNYIL